MNSNSILITRQLFNNDNDTKAIKNLFHYMLFNLPQYHLSTYKFKCNIAYMHTLSACSNLWSSHNLNCKLLTADHYLYKKL